MIETMLSLLYINQINQIVKKVASRKELHVQFFSDTNFQSKKVVHILISIFKSFKKNLVLNSSILAKQNNKPCWDHLNARINQAKT